MRHVMLTLALCSSCGLQEEEVVSHARQDELIRRGDDDGIIIMNGLSPGHLGENLLLNDANTRSKLIGSSLSTASFASGELATAVREDPRAREVLKYVVRCALGPSSSVTAGGVTYMGDAELCPSWATSGIVSDMTCQRQVTSCLLGVSNVMGMHVPVSMRGGGVGNAAAPSMHPRSFQPSGEPVRSLQPCEATSYGVQRDCGWGPVDDAAAEAAQVDMVFACTPHSPVAVGAGSTCPGGPLGTMSPGSDKVLRVCSGLAACDHASAVAENQGACGSIRPHVQFDCPDAGTYVVMQRDYAVYVPARTLGTMIVGQTGSLGPASEASLFPAREGAFYGTLFEGALGRKVTLVNGKLVTTVSSYKEPIFERLYSCLDAEWDAPQAYQARRICGLGGQCLSDSQGVCQAGVCRVVDDAPEGSGWFSSCKGRDGLLYDDALTTFLRQPCELISQSPQDPACQR